MDLPKYVQVLEREYLRRKNKNPSYSLRAFALALGLSQTALLKIMKEQKKLSDERAELVCQKLSWDQRNTAYFLLLVLYWNTKSLSAKNTLQEMIQKQYPEKLGLSADFDALVAS